MRRLFLALFLFTLSSSHRLYRRSEDVDPLLKELFSEIKTPSPKDRRDGQTSGVLEPGAASDKAPSHDKNHTSASGPQGEGEIDSGDLSDKNEKDDKSGPDDNKASVLPTNDLPPENKAAISPAKDSLPDNKATISEGKDLPSDNKASMLPAKDSPPVDKATILPAKDSKLDNKAPISPAKDSSSDNKATISAGKDSPSEKKAPILPARDSPPDDKATISLTKDSQPQNKAEISPAKDSLPDNKAQISPAKDSQPQQELDSKAAAKKDETLGSDTSGKVTGGTTKGDSDSNEDNELFSSGSDVTVPNKTSSAGDTDEKSIKSSSQASADETKNKMVTAEQNSAVASPGFALVSDQGLKPSEQVADVSSPTDQSGYTSYSSKASVIPAVATNVLPSRKQETSVPSNEGAGVTSDWSQSRNSQDFSERTRGNVPETSDNTGLFPNIGSDVQQASNNENLRNSIPQAPAAVTQPVWSAINSYSAPSLSSTQETNEKAELVKKTNIPDVPHHPGSFSYPLQLNRHSPGAELIKRFFIEKKLAKKKKEEDAKQKSLIGDGKYSVSSNNGYYNYAAAPPVPPPSLTGLKENGNKGICVDKYDSCPEFAKNHYCTDYKSLMKVQCRKSCRFCDNDDGDDDEDDDEESDKPENDKKDEENKSNDDDNDDDDDTDGKTNGKSDKKLRKKNNKIAKEDDDDDDDGSGVNQTSSGSGEQFTDDSGSSEADSASGSGSGSESKEEFEDFNSKSSDKGSGSADDLPPTAEELEDDDSEENDSGSGSGKSEDSNDDDDDDGDELAKDLAEEELFTQNVKKNTIPNPSEPSAPAPYPKINLKDIARYVSLYRTVAKKLFGEALDSAKKEFVAQQSKKSNIPIPIKEKLKSESKPSSSSLEGFYSSQEQKKRDNIPMNPNNAAYTPTDESWANRAYKEAESYLRSKIPEFKNFAPPAMFNYPFYINDPNKTEEETNEGKSSKKSEIPENPEEKYNKTLQEILLRDHINKPSTDPYEYLRNMIPGSSMKPIANKNGITYVPDSFSRPIQLRTKSQWFDLVAKKKSSIPKVPQTAPVRARSNVAKPAHSVPQIQTKPEALAAQATQYKSTVPQTQAAYEYQSSSPAPESADSAQSQPGIARADIPQSQPQMQQVPSAPNADFLQSSERDEQETNPASSLGEADTRSTDSKSTLQNLPPLLHATAVPGQSSGATKGFHLPPLNHGELPPLHHGSNNPSNYLTSEFHKSANKGASFTTAQYTSTPVSNQEKSANPLVDKQKDRSLLKEKVAPVQDMQIGIPNAYTTGTAQKQPQTLQQFPLKSSSVEQTPKSRQMPNPYPADPYPQPMPPEGGPTQYTSPPSQNSYPKPAPLPKTSFINIPDDTPQLLLTANTNPAYIPEENYVVPVLKKNLIRPRPDMECDSGWEGASGDFGNFCYKVVYQRQTWEKAHESCKGLNANLFSVKNAYEQRFLNGLASTPLWIGYQDKASDGTWSWSDGSTSVYTNWDSSRQRDEKEQSDCVLLDGEEGKWRDAPCSKKLKFLCKKSGGCDVNSGWKMLTLSSVKGCYKSSENTQSWDDALQTCNKGGGNLASILSNDEQTMISQVYSNDNLWIGYNDRENEGDWTWTDRMTSSYTNWDEASPNNGGVSCAVVTSPVGSWHDESCKKKHDFICKKFPKGSAQDTNVDDAMSPPVAALLQNHTQDSLLEDLSHIGGPAPAVPVYFWPLLKATSGQTRGTDHAEPHGKIRQVHGGIELNGVDSWLDGGDFHGKCFSDPELCIKGLSVAMQVNFDSNSRFYQNKHFVLDTSGEQRGVSVYIKNNSLHYRVITGSKAWELTTDLMTNEWQDVVFTWKKEEGLTLYVNGAFKDSVKGGMAISPAKDEQTHFLVGKSKDDVFTKMYISSISVYPRVLTTENIPFVFAYDDTVLPSYRWLLSKIGSSSNRRTTIPTTKAIKVKGFVKPVDGGLFISGGEDSYIHAGDFSNECLSDPRKCQAGFSFSCKLKFNKIVRSYTDPKYILDSGAGHDGPHGISAYLTNNNLYFDVALSTNEDTLRWTVRAPIYTIRWQRVVLSWSLAKGLTLYMDGNFRGSTNLPKSVPVVGRKTSSQFIIGRNNQGPKVGSAEFAISSLAIYDSYLGEKDMSGLFGDKSMPYPGLIREIWRDIPGAKISDLRSSAYYPNDPSEIQIIENFDSPFDLDKNYGSKVKGYFIPPESGSYIFYLAGSRSAELWLSEDEHESDLKRVISFNNGSAHNQWNRSPSQSSKPIDLEAGRYYFVVAVQKGTSSSDSLSAGVKLPSGRFIRPLTKETLQWRRRGNRHSGLIREVWKDLGGYQVSDLTSNSNFPNNPSSVEVIDNFDAPFNVEDNYGSRLRGFFVAPETGYYRFYLAADSSGELWISSDESEANLRKMVSITGWTDHNEWLKYAEQKSEKVHMKEGKSYFITVYQKAEKLGDCASVAVEMPSGHFEGPIKQKHLSWKLADGRSGPGPSSESSALPKPVGLFPLDNTFGAKDVINQEQVLVKGVKLTSGSDGRKTAYEFFGDKNSYIEIPKTNKLDTKYSMTLLASIFPTGNDGPILHYSSDGWGVHLWQFNENQLFVRFVRRDGRFTQPLDARVLQTHKWNAVGASYDNSTGVAQLWHDGKMVKSRNIGQIQLRTQLPIRLGAQNGDKRQFKGKISCVQIFDRPLTAEQVGTLRNCPVKGFNDGEDASGSGEENSEELTAPGTLSVNQLQEEDTEEEIQGSEVTSANKCRPNPCQNDGRCVIDLKRMDGYRCQCTSDFAGRHCQVSKPDANSPVVKKTTIAHPTQDAVPKQGTEDYQKIDTTKKFNGEVSKDRKEDVYLLYQKVGCYSDNVGKRDLPSQISLKAVTQELCVRECVVRDEGFSYFGLQSGTKCFCGKNYGKYGKAPEDKCDRRCRGNEDENCGGDEYNMVYFYGIGTNYTIRTYTGNMEGAGTKANIYVTLFGDKGDSGFRLLTPGDKKYAKGSVDTQVIVLPELGELRKVKVLHDNSGSDPSWFLDKIVVEDERGKSYEFVCNQWLSETQGGGRTERLLSLRKRKRSQH